MPTIVRLNKYNYIFIVQPINQGDIKIVVQEDPLISKIIMIIHEPFIDNEYFKEILMKQQVDIFLFVNPRSGSR
jgi:hypothetical protein